MSENIFVLMYHCHKLLEVTIQVNRMQCSFQHVRAPMRIRSGTALTLGPPVPVVIELFKDVYFRGLSLVE
jgi:hypothetical protein